MGKIEEKEKAQEFYQKVFEKVPFLSFENIILSDTLMNFYAFIIGRDTTATVLLKLENPETRLQAFNELRANSFFAGLAYAYFNPEFKELIKSAVPGLKEIFKAELDKIKMDESFKIQKETRYG